MTTLTIESEGDDAHAVFREAISHISLTDVDEIDVTISFGSFTLTAEGETLDEVADSLRAVDYNQQPTAITLKTAVSAGADVVEPTEPASRSDAGSDTTTDGDVRDHTPENPAHIGRNTMEHVALERSVRCLYDTEGDEGDEGDAFETVGTYFTSRRISDWDDPIAYCDMNQLTNAFYRLYKKGLLDRTRGSSLPDVDTSGSEFAYKLNRAGAAEVQRLGVPDIEESPAFMPEYREE